MRVADLIPRSWATTPEPARRGDRDPVAVLQSDINRAFDDFLRLFPLPVPAWGAALPDAGSDIRVDVVETEKEVKVEAELPGLDEADIDLQVTDGVLVISAEKKAEGQVDGDGYILRERRYGRLERRVPLPEGIDAGAAQASFKTGVMTVMFPKTVEARDSTQRIAVQSD